MRLPLPDGYVGAVIERQQPGASTPAACQDGAGGSGSASEEPGWAATAAFSHLHYHQHDAAPLRDDGLRRCLDWAGLAAALHAPVAPSVVAAGVGAGGREAGAAAV